MAIPKFSDDYSKVFDLDRGSPSAWFGQSPQWYAGDEASPAGYYLRTEDGGVQGDAIDPYRSTNYRDLKSAGLWSADSPAVKALVYDKAYDFNPNFDYEGAPAGSAGAVAYNLNSLMPNHPQNMATADEWRDAFGVVRPDLQEGARERLQRLGRTLEGQAKVNAKQDFLSKFIEPMILPALTAIITGPAGFSGMAAGATAGAVGGAQGEGLGDVIKGGLIGGAIGGGIDYLSGGTPQPGEVGVGGAQSGVELINRAEPGIIQKGLSAAEEGALGFAPAADAAGSMFGPGAAETLDRSLIGPDAGAAPGSGSAFAPAAGTGGGLGGGGDAEAEAQAQEGKAAEALGGAGELSLQQLGDMVNESIGGSVSETAAETVGEAAKTTQVGAQEASAGATNETAKKLVDVSGEPAARTAGASYGGAGDYASVTPSESVSASQSAGIPAGAAASQGIIDKILSADPRLQAAGLQVGGSLLAGAMKNAGDIQTAERKAELELKNREALTNWFREFVRSGSQGGVGVHLGVRAPAQQRPLRNSSGGLIGSRL